MPNQPEDWWKEAADEIYSLEDYEPMEDHHAKVAKLVAKADRRATLRTWEEAKEIMKQLKTEPNSGAANGNNIACEYAIRLINSRIQQYDQTTND